MTMFKSSILKLLNRFGFRVVRTSALFRPEELVTIEKVKEFTVTSPERLSGLIDAVKYIVANQIEGDFLECGVWRGGSMMAAMFTLLELKDTSRHFYLFDTFQGMTEPTERDVMFDGQTAKELLDRDKKREGADYNWVVASLEDAERNLLSTGYPREKIHFVKGKVEDTIPGGAPSRIALLRLDTDWYESTAHEMKHLYPLLAENGVLIIDDYGHWQGARQAVDEFFAAQRFSPLLSRLDYTGRMLVKPSGGGEGRSVMVKRMHGENIATSAFQRSNEKL